MEFKENSKPLFFFLIYPVFAVALNCTSPTPKALFQALEEDVFQYNMIRPVKNLSEPLTIYIDITLVEILGVVSSTWNVFYLEKKKKKIIILNPWFKFFF